MFKIIQVLVFRSTYYVLVCILQCTDGLEVLSVVACVLHVSKGQNDQEYILTTDTALVLSSFH